MFVQGLVGCVLACLFESNFQFCKFLLQQRQFSCPVLWHLVRVYQISSPSRWLAMPCRHILYSTTAVSWRGQRSPVLYIQSGRSTPRKCCPEIVGMDVAGGNGTDWAGPYTVHNDIKRVPMS